MDHTKRKCIAKGVTGMIAIMVFLLTEEVGRRCYMKWFPTSLDGGELCAEVWFFSVYFAPSGLMLSCLSSLRKAGSLVIFALFSIAVIYVFRDTPLWIVLLLLSYMSAMLVALLTKLACDQIGC